MLKKIASSAIIPRALPFIVFAAITFIQGQFGDVAQYWLYGLKSVIGAWMLWVFRPYLKEMVWKVSWEAVVIGVLVFIAWVGLDGHYPLLMSRASTFNPERTFGSGSIQAWISIAVRIIGSSLVVPPLEEVFYRSFLYRYTIRKEFLKVPLNAFDFRAFVFTAVVFGIGHFEILPGILCGFAYQWLVYRKNRLGDAITAHSITNLLLGIWIVLFKQYHF